MQHQEALSSRDVRALVDLGRSLASVLQKKKEECDGLNLGTLFLLHLNLYTFHPFG